MQEAEDVLGRYEPAVQRIAKFIRPYATTIDHRAQDRADYISLFRTTALRAHDRRPDNPGFVFASLRNAAADSFRKPKSCQFVPLGEGDDAPLDEHDLDREVEAREIVSKLRARMSPRDMEILEAWAATGVATDAWRLTGRHTPRQRSEVARRVRAVLDRAKAVLEGLSIFGPAVGAQTSISTERNTMLDQLQKDAERLGIPFTNDTTEDELRSMIAARNNQFDGLPALDPTVEVKECFGLAWGADVDETCQECPAKQHCFVKMANETIPTLNIENGRELSSSELAEKLGPDVSSIELVLAYRSKKLQKSSPQPVPEKSGTQPPAPPPPVVDAAPAEESDVSGKQTAKAKAKAKAPKKAPPKKNGKLPHADAAKAMEGVAPDPRQAGSASPVAAPAKVRAAKSATPAAAQAPESSRKRKASPSGKVKAPPKKLKARSGSSTSSTASRKKAPPKKLNGKTPAKRPEGQEPWGEHTFLARWERERKRSKEIARVTPGSKLVREFAGKQHEVQCRQGHYLYQGQKYPTLYSVVLEITGGKEYPVLAAGKAVRGKMRRMTNWSATRFFQLHNRE